jgi:hypothetical protein
MLTFSVTLPKPEPRTTFAEPASADSTTTVPFGTLNSSSLFMEYALIQRVAAGDICEPLCASGRRRD